jgi:hypothetical protein
MKVDIVDSLTGLFTYQERQLLPIVLVFLLTTYLTSRNILKAFEVIGVSPPDGEVVLKRFTSTPPYEDEAPELKKHGDSDTGKQLLKL